MRFLSTSVAIGTALVLASAVTAGAQTDITPKIEVAAGYSSLHDYGAKQHLARGVFLSGTYHLTGALGITGEVGSNSKRFSFPVESETAIVRTKLDVFMAGGRYDLTLAGLRINGHMLGGAVRESGAVPIFRLSVASAETKPAVQAGLGASLPLQDGLSAVVMLDYRRIFSDSYQASNEMRLAVGLGVAFGRR